MVCSNRNAINDLRSPFDITILRGLGQFQFFPGGVPLVLPQNELVEQYTAGKAIREYYNGDIIVGVLKIFYIAPFWRTCWQVDILGAGKSVLSGFDALGLDHKFNIGPQVWLIRTRSNIFYTRYYSRKVTSVIREFTI